MKKKKKKNERETEQEVDRRNLEHGRQRVNSRGAGPTNVEGIVEAHRLLCITNSDFFTAVKRNSLISSDFYHI